MYYPLSVQVPDDKDQLYCIDLSYRYPYTKQGWCAREHSSEWWTISCVSGSLAVEIMGVEVSSGQELIEVLRYRWEPATYECF